MATSTRRRTRGAASSTGSGGRIPNMARDTIAEIRKVTWPDQETTRNLTMFVIALSVFLGALLGGVDAVFVRVWENIPTF